MAIANTKMYMNSGKILGTHFIQIDPLNYTKDKKMASIFLDNNRVKVVHLAEEDQFNNINSTLKLTMNLSSNNNYFNKGLNFCGLKNIIFIDNLYF